MENSQVKDGLKKIKTLFMPFSKDTVPIKKLLNFFYYDNKQYCSHVYNFW